VERRKELEQEPLEDLELTEDEVDTVTGGKGKAPYVTFTLEAPIISSYSTSPPSEK
jgi:hypothetical protein